MVFCGEVMEAYKDPHSFRAIRPNEFKILPGAQNTYSYDILSTEVH
jgi:hypothetical protein